MRSRPCIRLLLSVVLLLVIGLLAWRWTDPRVAPAGAIAEGHRLNAVSVPARHSVLGTDPRTLRLSNTDAPLNLLAHSGSALLLENALLDTALPLSLSIPAHLRAQGDPGAYIVQSRTPLNNVFRTRLRAAGADIVAYIPNQAYLVHASQAVAWQLQADSQVQAVLPYEPYFKLKPPLLALAVAGQPLPDNQSLNLRPLIDAFAAAIPND